MKTKQYSIHDTREMEDILLYTPLLEVTRDYRFSCVSIFDSYWVDIDGYAVLPDMLEKLYNVKYDQDEECLTFKYYEDSDTYSLRFWNGGKFKHRCKLMGIATFLPSEAEKEKISDLYNEMVVDLTFDKFNIDDILYNTYDEEFVDLFNYHFLDNCEDCGDLIFDNSVFYTDEYEEDYYCDDCGFSELTWDEWFECYVYANEYFPVEYRHSDFHFDGKMFNKYGED